jgi:hypothetical protein
MGLDELLKGENPVLNLEFLDSETVDSYLDQLTSVWGNLTKDKTFKFEISVPFFKAGVEHRPPGDLSNFQKIFKVLHGLQLSGQIIEGFPPSKQVVTTSQLYFSSGPAVRYRIPKERLTAVEYDADIFLWLMRQDMAPPESTQNLLGNFAYLLQRRDHGGDYDQAQSVYSATQFLMEDLGIIQASGDPREQAPFRDMPSPKPS